MAAVETEVASAASAVGRGHSASRSRCSRWQRRSERTLRPRRHRCRCRRRRARMCPRTLAGTEARVAAEGGWECSASRSRCSRIRVRSDCTMRPRHHRCRCRRRRSCMYLCTLTGRGLPEARAAVLPCEWLSGSHNQCNLCWWHKSRTLRQGRHRRSRLQPGNLCGRVRCGVERLGRDWKQAYRRKHIDTCCRIDPHAKVPGGVNLSCPTSSLSGASCLCCCCGRSRC